MRVTIPEVKVVWVQRCSTSALHEADGLKCLESIAIVPPARTVAMKFTAAPVWNKAVCIKTTLLLSIALDAMRDAVSAHQFFAV